MFNITNLTFKNDYTKGRSVGYVLINFYMYVSDIRYSFFKKECQSLCHMVFMDNYI